MRDQITVKGFLEYDLYRNGVYIETVSDSNMVVTVGKEILAKLLAGVAGKHITHVAFGDVPDGPTSADTTITNPVTKTVTVEYPTTMSVRFIFSVASGEMNGKNIREFGLMTADGILFARKTRGELLKTSDLSFEGRWTISF